MLITNETNIYNGTTEIVKAYAGNKVVYEKTTPPPYTPVQYIRAEGSQYIDAGVTPNQDYTVELKYEPTVNVSGGTAWFGSRNNDQKGIVISHWRGGWCVYGTSEGSVGLQFSAGTAYYFRLDKNVLYRSTDDGQTFSVQATYNYNTFTSTTHLHIFRDSGTNYGRGKLYYMKVYDNGVLVRDFIPVLDGNNVPCLFDKVSNTFFYNGGTGQFMYE